MHTNTTFRVNLKEADRVEITTLIDNHTDGLLSMNEAKNPLVTRDPHKQRAKANKEALLAEHGLSLLIKIFSDTWEHTILFDGGYTKVGIIHNIRVLDIDLSSLEAIVLSHGHRDHYGGLYTVAKHMQKNGVPLIAHPDAFLNRYREQSNGTMVRHGFQFEKRLDRAGLQIMKCKTPYLLASNMLATTGEIERLTDFESISTDRFIRRKGKLERDFILDDQALVLNLKRKGLVIISGCAHSGIINTVKYAKKITQLDRVYAILGGFHLPEQRLDSRVERTVAALVEINPTLVVPMHCTSWVAMHSIYKAMPQAFILSNVGTRFNL